MQYRPGIGNAHEFGVEIQVKVQAAVGFSVYLVGFVASFFLPEPRGVDLPE